MKPGPAKVAGFFLPWRNVLSCTAAPESAPALLVIGNGMVGHHCVEQLVQRGALQRYRIHVFGEEPVRAYDRVHLSEYFGGRDAESLARGDSALYEQQDITRHLTTPRLRYSRSLIGEATATQ